MRNLPVEKRSTVIDINALTPDQIVAVSGELGRKINFILTDAKKQIQDMLNVYNMQLMLRYSINLKKEEETTEEVEETTASET